MTPIPRSCLSILANLFVLEERERERGREALGRWSLSSCWQWTYCGRDTGTTFRHKKIKTTVLLTWMYPFMSINPPAQSSVLIGFMKKLSFLPIENVSPWAQSLPFPSRGQLRDLRVCQHTHTHTPTNTNSHTHSLCRSDCWRFKKRLCVYIYNCCSWH